MDKEWVLEYCLSVEFVDRELLFATWTDSKGCALEIDWLMRWVSRNDVHWQYSGFRNFVIGRIGERIDKIASAIT